VSLSRSCAQWAGIAVGEGDTGFVDVAWLLGARGPDATEPCPLVFVEQPAIARQDTARSSALGMHLR
jgi:hypothetical protein